MAKFAFDLDGTLITCRNRQLTLMKTVLSTYSVIDFDYSTFWSLKRDGLSNISAMNSLGININLSRRVNVDWIGQIEDYYWLMYDSCYDNILESLCKIKEFGNDVFVITARKNKGNLFLQLDQLGLSSVITDCFIARHSVVVEEKEAMLRKTKSDIFFGDTETDYYAAKNAGVNFYASVIGQRSEVYLRSVGVENFIHDVLHLEELYK